MPDILKYLTLPSLARGGTGSSTIRRLVQKLSATVINPLTAGHLDVPYRCKELHETIYVPYRICHPCDRYYLLKVV